MKKNQRIEINQIEAEMELSVDFIRTDENNRPISICDVTLYEPMVIHKYIGEATIRNKHLIRIPMDFLGYVEKCQFSLRMGDNAYITTTKPLDTFVAFRNTDIIELCPGDFEISMWIY